MEITNIIGFNLYNNNKWKLKILFELFYIVIKNEN